MKTCLFCKIVAGEIPADKIYEDNDTLVFRDIAPQAPIHLLAIPKVHYAGVHEIPQEKCAEIMGALANAIRAAVERSGLREDGYRLVVNFGETAGQAVPHIHYHILGGRKMSWPPG